MTTHSLDISQHQAAKIAGVGYLLIIVLAIFAEFFVRTQLVVPGDTATTAANIMANESTFRLGFVAWIVIVIVDVIISWALYILFKPVNKSLSLLAALFRLVYIAIKGAALIHMFMAVQVLSNTDYFTTSGTNPAYAQALLYLDGHNYGFLIGLVFFGIHCLLLGVLAYQSNFIPKLLGMALMIACFGYLIDSFANFVLPNYADYADTFLLVVAVPAFIAEVWFCLYLLFKNIDVPKRHHP